MKLEGIFYHTVNDNKDAVPILFPHAGKERANVHEIKNSHDHSSAINRVNSLHSR